MGSFVRRIAETEDNIYNVKDCGANVTQAVTVCIY